MRQSEGFVSVCVNLGFVSIFDFLACEFNGPAVQSDLGALCFLELVKAVESFAVI